MTDFVRIAFNLDRVLGGKYAGRALIFTNGVELLKREDAVMEIEVDGFDAVTEGDILVHRPVKRRLRVGYQKESVIEKDGFVPVADAAGVTMGFVRADDGLPLPSAEELRAMRDEVKALPARLDPAEQRIKDLEEQVRALTGAPKAV